jgi:hypothetical protein
VQAEVLCIVIVLCKGVKLWLSFGRKNIYEDVGRRSTMPYVCTVSRREEVARDWEKVYIMSTFITCILRRYCSV